MVSNKIVLWIAHFHLADFDSLKLSNSSAIMRELEAVLAANPSIPPAKKNRGGEKAFRAFRSSGTDTPAASYCYFRNFCRVFLE